MAAQKIWQPKEEGLIERCGVLEQHISPPSDKSLIWQHLQHYSQIPDFSSYLAFIFAHAEGKSVEIRQAAGLLLKNSLKVAFKSIDPAYQQYIKAELVPCLGADCGISHPNLDEEFRLLRSITCWTLSRFSKFIVQRGNLRIVYDAIGTLADAVGEELNQPSYLQILVPSLIEKWLQLSNSYKDLFPLLECFISIAQALGSGFTQFAEPLYQRCINIIQSQLLAKVDNDVVSAGVQYDKEFIVCSLDLLSWLVEALGSKIESLFSPSNLRDLLLRCCMDDAPDVRQSAFALLGDISRVCPGYLRPQLSGFLNVSTKQMVLGDGAWEQCLSALEPKAKDKLSQYQV